MINELINELFHITHSVKFPTVSLVDRHFLLFGQIAFRPDKFYTYYCSYLAKYWWIFMKHSFSESLYQEDFRSGFRSLLSHQSAAWEPRTWPRESLQIASVSLFAAFTCDLYMKCDSWRPRDCRCVHWSTPGHSRSHLVTDGYVWSHWSLTIQGTKI